MTLAIASSGFMTMMETIHEPIFIKLSSTLNLADEPLQGFLSLI